MDSQRVDELLRINAELAAEIRRLSRDGASPRGGQMTTGRRLAHLLEERADLLAARTALQAELDAARAECHELGRDNAILAAEIARLRRGYRGFLRRLRARFVP